MSRAYSPGHIVQGISSMAHCPGHIVHGILSRVHYPEHGIQATLSGLHYPRHINQGTLSMVYYPGFIIQGRLSRFHSPSSRYKVRQVARMTRLTLHNATMDKIVKVYTVYVCTAYHVQRTSYTVRLYITYNILYNTMK